MSKITITSSIYEDGFKDLSKKLNIERNKLDRRLKQYLNINYNNFVNDYIDISGKIISIEIKDLSFEFREIILKKWNKRKLERQLTQKIVYKKKVSKI